MDNLWKLFLSTKYVRPKGSHPALSKDREHAITALKAIGRVDVDRYLERIDPRTLLVSPIGATEECLTIEDLEEYSELSVGLKPVAPHLSLCSDCYEALRVYQSVKKRALDPVGEVDPFFWVDPPDPIELRPANVEFALTLQCKHMPALDPSWLSAEGVFDKIDCRDVVLLDSDELVGSTFRAHFVAVPPAKLLRTLGPPTDFCDWLRVTVQTRTGERITSSELMRFRLQTL